MTSDIDGPRQEWTDHLIAHTPSVPNVFGERLNPPHSRRDRLSLRSPLERFADVARSTGVYLQHSMGCTFRALLRRRESPSISRRWSGWVVPACIQDELMDFRRTLAQ